MTACKTGYLVRAALTGALVVFFAVSESVAEGRPDLKVELMVEREVPKLDADGETTMVREPVSETRQGDVLIYTLRYQNQGDAPARGATLKDPVPAGTTLVRDSVRGEGTQISFSLDGENFSEWPMIQRDMGGKVEWVEAPATAVRHIKWKLAKEVDPGAGGEASFKVVVR